MRENQRRELDALLRLGRPGEPQTLSEQRTGFEQSQAKPIPATITITETTLGGRPAVALAPAGAERPGVLLYLHGGGYVIGSARTGAFLAAALADRTGLRALSLDYRLAPENPFPAAVTDGLAAYRQLLSDGVAPETLLLAGDSAGGGLAIATLVAARDAGLPMPAAVAVFSPWVDLTLTGESMRTKQDADPIFTRGPLRAYADRYLGGGDPAAPLASPIFADLTGLPPLLVQAGSNELLLDDAVRLAARAAADEVDVTLEVVGGVPHVFQGFAGSLDDADDALDRAGHFLARRLPAH